MIGSAPGMGIVTFMVGSILIIVSQVKPIRLYLPTLLPHCEEVPYLLASIDTIFSSEKYNDTLSERFFAMRIFFAFRYL
jgi:hypothetical protein